MEATLKSQREELEFIRSLIEKPLLPKGML